MRSCLKVAFVTAFPEDPTAPQGGVESVSVNLTRALLEFDDLELHIVTTKSGLTVATEDRWRGAVVHRLPRRGRRTLTDAIGPGRRLVASFLRGLTPDVIHAHDVYGLMIKGLSIPRVQTIHGFIHADTLVSGPPLPLLRSWLWRIAERAAWADQPHIISISPYVRERLAGIATGVIHDIENPIAPSFFDIRRDERNLVIFSAAAICRRKNTLALVDAFAGVVQSGLDARLRLAGAVIEPSYGEQVEARIHERGLEGRVDLVGRLRAAEVGRELAGASIFALASLEENAPVGIEEAMAAGVPVVASNRCGMPYLVQDGETGFLVNPEDPRDISDRLRDLLIDDGLRRRMSERSRQVARDRFHPSAVARRTRDVYFRAVDCRRRSSLSALVGSV